MTHTIIVRPASDFEPHIDGIVNHTVQIAEGAEIITESTEYLRRLGEALIERADRVDKANGKQDEPAELQHPGTWLPGDQIDWDGTPWTRHYQRTWTGASGAVKLGDTSINNLLRSDDARITHLVPREQVSA